MARKQVLVQLEDAQVAALDRLATASDDSRSELIRRAIDRYVEAIGKRRQREQRDRVPAADECLQLDARSARASWSAKASTFRCHPSSNGPLMSVT